MFFLYAMLILAALAYAMFGIFSGHYGKRASLPLVLAILLWVPALRAAIEGGHYAHALILCGVGIVAWMAITMHVLLVTLRKRRMTALA